LVEYYVIKAVSCPRVLDNTRYWLLVFHWVSILMESVLTYTKFYLIFIIHIL